MPLSARAVRHAWLSEVIRGVHVDSRGVYGARRVHAELTLGHGIAVGHGAVELGMRRAGLQGISGRPRFRRIPNVATASDLVDRQFQRSEPDRLWVADITKHRTREGKVYCAVVLDVFSRRVVGWSIDSSPTAALATNALGMSIDQRQPAAGSTAIHSDQGSQPIHVMGIHSPRGRFRAVAVDGFDRGLLRQCPHRVVLEPDADRTPRPAALAHTSRAGERHLRLPRDLPQSSATALRAWHDHTNRVRSSKSTNHSGMRIQNLAYPEPGTPQSLRDSRGGSDSDTTTERGGRAPPKTSHPTPPPPLNTRPLLPRKPVFWVKNLGSPLFLSNICGARSGRSLWLGG